MPNSILISSAGVDAAGKFTLADALNTVVMSVHTIASTAAHSTRSSERLPHMGWKSAVRNRILKYVAFSSSVRPLGVFHNVLDAREKYFQSKLVLPAPKQWFNTGVMRCLSVN